MRVHALGPGPRRWLCVFAFILALGIAGCSSNQSKPQARPTTSTARQVTTTVASTKETPAPTSAPPMTGPPTTGPQTTSEATRTTSADPATVVREYFGAINAHDYPRAFELGGKNFDNSYSHFVDGFANTEHDAVMVLGMDGPNVTVLLVATDNAGRRSVYQGTYTIEWSAQSCEGSPPSPVNLHDGSARYRKLRSFLYWPKCLPARWHWGLRLQRFWKRAQLRGGSDQGRRS
jgi:hypothetical protein